MLARRPLLYLTIPSLALLIGLWFRRKKAIAAKCDSGGKTAKETNKVSPTAIAPLNSSSRNISDSVPIGSASDDSGDASLLLLNTSGGSGDGVGSNSSTKGGPNSRSPPIPIANKPGCGGHTSDELNSVDEFDVESFVSPVDLPGSYERRNFEFIKDRHLYQKQRPKSNVMDVPPKVITACKSPKISPKNAFSEATTSTPSTKNKQQKSPKSPATAQEEEGEESLIIQSRMAKLSLLDDSVKVTNNIANNSVEKTNARPAENNNTTTDCAVLEKEEPVEEKQPDNTTSTQEQQQQPPTISSPPLSLYSVHSNDSGKGSSPTQSEVAAHAVDDNCYEFLVHEKYVGLLIGRNGTTVKKLHGRCGVHMIVRRVPNCPRPTDRVCAIMGAPSDIDVALRFVRQRMPLEKYPDLTLERVHLSAAASMPRLGVKETVVDASEERLLSHKQKPVMPIHYPVAQLPLSLSLVEGINNDVVISAILNGGHVFLQQPSHPTFQQLKALHACMAQHYSTGAAAPVLEIPPQPDSICVAPVSGDWFRVVIVNYTPADQQCLVKFLDFGGFVTVPAADLRQIRTDFMALSFQSTECVLSNLRPIGGGEWSPAAADLVTQLGSGRVLQAQVAGYTVDGLPEVFLYATLGPDSIAFINQELVAQGFAEWMEDDEEDEEVVETEQQQQEPQQQLAVSVQ